MKIRKSKNFVLYQFYFVRFEETIQFQFQI